MESEISKYFWDGENVTIRHGYVLVQEDKEHPLKWYNYEVYLCKQDRDSNYETLKAIIPAIEIITKNGYKFHISNHYGVGVYSLLQGGTWRQISFHFDEPYEFIGDEVKKIPEYDQIKYHAHELKRMAWQRVTYPNEYKAIERLRKLIKQT
jgi:hypothetical protein